MKNTTFVLDTSFILAILNRSDILHQEAKAKLFSLTPDELKLEIPLICVIEALIQNPNPQKYISLLSELIDKRDFEITTKIDLDFISKLPLKTRSRIKANDCIVIAITKRLKGVLLTLDKKLQKACVK